jgi:hypothetical protein
LMSNMTLNQLFIVIDIGTDSILGLDFCVCVCVCVCETIVNVFVKFCYCHIRKEDEFLL